jgi:cytochrome c biogenesis factor
MGQITVQHDQDGRVTFKVLIIPLVMWIGIGGFVLTAGAIVVMWPDKGEKRRLVFSYVREEMMRHET